MTNGAVSSHKTSNNKKAVQEMTSKGREDPKGMGKKKRNSPMKPLTKSLAAFSQESDNNGHCPGSSEVSFVAESLVENPKLRLTTVKESSFILEGDDYEEEQDEDEEEVVVVVVVAAAVVLVVVVVVVV